MGPRNSFISGLGALILGALLILSIGVLHIHKSQVMRAKATVVNQGEIGSR